MTRFPDVRKWIYDKNGKMWDRLQLCQREDDRPRRMDKPIPDGDELHILLNIGGG